MINKVKFIWTNFYHLILLGLLLFIWIFHARFISILIPTFCNSKFITFNKTKQTNQSLEHYNLRKKFLKTLEKVFSKRSPFQLIGTMEADALKPLKTFVQLMFLDADFSKDHLWLLIPGSVTGTLPSNY